MIKKLTGWRTMIVAGLVTLMGLVGNVVSDPTLHAWLAVHSPGLLTGTGLVMAFLRTITTTPLGEPKEPVESGDGTTK